MTMSRALGSESVNHGVRVIAVNPGATETDRQVVRWKALAKEKFGDENRWRELTTGFPMGRLATLDEMKGDLDKKLADLDETVAREKQRATDSEIGRLAFPSFLQSIEVRRKNIRTTMKDLETERSRQREELAAAAAQLASAFTFEHVPVHRIGLYHAIENEASCRAATKAGFEYEGTLRQSWRYPDGELHDEHVHSGLPSH